jgi:hypothetical protein
MDCSLLSAGPAVHFKIAAVALVCAIVVVLVGVNARTDVASAGVQTKGAAVKAGLTSKYADQERSTIR